MRIGTAEVMREIDKYSIEVLKIPSIVLMENAALKVVKNIDIENVENCSIICGKGNNGGDGLAVARHLYVIGKDVVVFLLGGEQGLSEDSQINYNILLNMGVKIISINNMEDINEMREYLEQADIIVDAIFGTGLNKNVEGIYSAAISVINESNSYILSIDIPSGLECNSGRVLGNSIRANKTVTFQLYKKGFLNYGVDKYTGAVVIEDIGIPKEAIHKFHENEYIMDENFIKQSMIKRNKHSHKGDYGRVVIVAGSKGFTGASYIATQGAVRSGAGLVTLCCDEEIQPILSSKLIEAMTLHFKDTEKLKELLKSSNCIAIGPGMGNNETTLQLVMDTLLNATCPVVIDADGLNVLKGNLHLLEESKNKVMITPHLGEMSKLTGLTIEEIKQNRMGIAQSFAQKYKCIVLLKGYNTVITDGHETIINPTGNSAMASGGMGDALTGIIASFIAQGYEPLKATSISAFIHGYTGEKLSKKMFCVSASQLLEELPYAIKELME